MSDKTARGILPSFRQGFNTYDLLKLSLVVIVLVGLFALPEAQKRALAFSYVDPTAFTAFTAHFVHLTWNHFVANLLGFVLLGGTGYILAVLGGRRQLFATLILLYLIVFPPVLSGLNLAVPREAITYGFSGLNMAVAGLLPLLLTEYAGQRIHGAIKTRHAPGFFFLVMTLISLIAIPTQPVTIVLATASGLITVVYAWQLIQEIRNQPDSVRPWPRSFTHRGGWLEFGVFSAIIVVGYPIIGYPADPATASQVVNIYVHTLGYALAFIGGYIGLELGVFD